VVGSVVVVLVDSVVVGVVDSVIVVVDAFVVDVVGSVVEVVKISVVVVLNSIVEVVGASVVLVVGLKSSGNSGLTSCAPVVLIRKHNKIKKTSTMDLIFRKLC